MPKIYLFITTLLLAFNSLAAKKDFTDKPYPVTGKSVPEMKVFDKSFVRLMKTWHMPGAAVAIVKDGKLIFNRGYGWADIDKQRPVEPDSLFRLASLSKVITAVATLKLIEDKQLNLNDNIFSVLSDLKPIQDRRFNPKQQKITVKHLLTMSSGWIASGKHRVDPMFGPWTRDMTNIMGKDNLPASCADTLRMMMTMPLRMQPGSAYVYSNIDYCVLGVLISKVSQNRYDHQGYEQYVQKTLFKPLDISTMYIGSTDASKVDPREVTYYRYLGHVDISNQTPSTYFPYGDDDMLHKNFANGGWVATAADFARFIHAVSDGKVLSKESLALMTAPPSYYKKKPPRYFGMGWKFKTVKGKQVWYQTGSFTGTSAVAIRDPNGVTMVVVLNARPPIYHMWKDFRPQLYKILHAATS